MTVETVKLNAFELAGIGDCASPDNSESDGAIFLLDIQDDVDRYLSELASPGETWADQELSDVAAEIADAAVPIYTHTLWSVFVDLSAWAEDLDDLGGPTGDMEQNAKMCLYSIAERVAASLIQDAYDAEREDSTD